jgi:hypothetical protein
VSSVAVASAAARYAGRTSQGAPISFTVSGAHVRNLRFTIYIKCPSRHIWRISASNFPAIAITHGAFDQRFVARDQRGSATVKGQLSGSRVRGTLFDRTYEPKEHHFCAGTATYELGGSRGTPSPSRKRHRKGHGGPSPRRPKPGRPPRPAA